MTRSQSRTVTLPTWHEATTGVVSIFELDACDIELGNDSHELARRGRRSEGVRREAQVKYLDHGTAFVMLREPGTPSPSEHSATRADPARCLRAEAREPSG